MAKFNEKLQEVGLTKSKLSRVIQTKIDNYTKLAEEGADAEALEKLDNEITNNIQALVNKRQAKPPKVEKPKAVKEEIEEEEEEEDEEEEEEEEEEEDEEQQREYQRKMQQERYRMREEYERSLALRQQQQQPEPKKSKAIWVLAGLVAVVTLGAVILKDK